MDLNSAGIRPSRLQLDRLATGELPEGSLALGPAERAHLEELEALSATLPPVDVAAIRARAVRLNAPANRSLGRWFAGLAAAAVVALAIWPTTPPSTTPIAFRGGATLDARRVGENALVPYHGEGLKPGDPVVFSVHPANHSAVVVLAIDGRGEVSVAWPEAGEDHQTLSNPHAATSLPGSLALDDAAGDELIVAVFGDDLTIEEAKDAISGPLESGGLEAVAAWARAHPDADAVLLRRAP